MGSRLFVAAGDVIPQPDKAFGAPRGLVASFGLIVRTAHAIALVASIGAPRRLVRHRPP